MYTIAVEEIDEAYINSDEEMRGSMREGGDISRGVKPAASATAGASGNSILRTVDATREGARRKLEDVHCRRGLEHGHPTRVLGAIYV